MSETTTKRSVEVSIKQLQCDKCGVIVDNGPEQATGWICCHVLQQQVPSILGPFQAPTLEAALAYASALPGAFAASLSITEQHLCPTCGSLFAAFVKDAPVPAPQPRVSLEKAEAAEATRNLFEGVRLLATAIAKVGGQPVPDFSDLLTPEGLEKIGDSGARLAQLLRETPPATLGPAFDEQGSVSSVMSGEGA